MSALKPGDIVRYYYLWARQAADGEESGRKARPACVVVRTPAEPPALFLFPLTSQKPSPSRDSLAVSEIECRRGGLDHPSWLILDEYNRVQADETYDLAGARPIGTFSPAFLRRIASTIKQVATRRRLRGVVRR
jgi:hypothetical protein